MMHHVFEEVVARIAIKTRGKEAETWLEGCVKRTFLSICQPFLRIECKEGGVVE